MATVAVMHPRNRAPNLSGTPAASAVLSGRPLLAFAEGEYADFLLQTLSGTLSGTLTLHLVLAADSATTGNDQWRAQLDRYNTGKDITTESFAANNDSTAAAVPSTARTVYERTITLTNKDGITAGEMLLVRITRLAIAGASGDIYLLGARIEEA